MSKKKYVDAKSEQSDTELSAAEAHFIRMTEAPLGPLITQMATPAVIANIIGVGYNLTDTFYVGRLSTAASAASGVVMPLMVAIQAIGLLMGAGAGNRIAVLLGKKDMDLSEKLVSTAFFTTFVISIILSILALIFRVPLAWIFGSTKTIEPLAVVYMVPLLYAGPFYCMSYVFDPLLRFQGLAAESMIGIGLGAILNIILEPIFIFTLHMGMFGAGLATGICETLSFILLFILFIKRSGVKLKWKQFSPTGFVYHEIIAGGLPNFIRNIMGSFATDIFNLAANPYGDAAIAAITISNRIVMLTASAEIGFGRGYQPVCGFNYGAHHYDRVKRGYYLIMRASVILLVVVAIAQSIWAPQLIQLFRNDPAVIKYGAEVLRWQSLSFPLYSYIICSNMMQQTLGHTVIASIVGLARQGIFLVPVLLIFPHFLGFFGVELAQPIGDTCTMLLTIPLQMYVMRELKDPYHEISKKQREEMAEVVPEQR